MKVVTAGQRQKVLKKVFTHPNHKQHQILPTKSPTISSTGIIPEICLAFFSLPSQIQAWNNILLFLKKSYENATKLGIGGGQRV